MQVFHLWHTLKHHHHHIHEHPNITINITPLPCTSARCNRPTIYIWASRVSALVGGWYKNTTRASYIGWRPTTLTWDYKTCHHHHHIQTPHTSTTTQCKWSICVSGWKGKHQCKLQWVMTTSVQVDYLHQLMEGKAPPAQVALVQSGVGHNNNTQPQPQPSPPLTRSRPAQVPLDWPMLQSRQLV